MEINNKHHGFLGLNIASAAYYLFQKKANVDYKQKTETRKQHWHDRDLSK